MVQSEVGDYEGPEVDDEDDEVRSQDENTADHEHEGSPARPHHPLDVEYLRKFPFCKNNETDELLAKIAKHHRQLRGAPLSLLAFSTSRIRSNAHSSY